MTEAAHFTKGGNHNDALRVFLGDVIATVADGDTHLRNRRLMQPMFNKAHIAGRGSAMIGQVRTTVSAVLDHDESGGLPDEGPAARLWERSHSCRMLW
ncbi:hypothetical protein [Streptomyces sp. NPDC001604]|uniref:hypothetical protein n=1 Tax=Streptomyces sp. NPDC001604 TaxID=3364593 RepID=UPI00368AC00E